ncbi:Uncharacterised protein [Vibrio cholerae]|nr:Uncharacterised protein [Vibrio cholerae]CSC71524.1 Uncharacterised protein [Vibrio cholerae]
MWRLWAVRNHITTLNALTFKHVQLTMFRDHLFVSVTAVTSDDQTTLTFSLFTERYGT